MVRRSFLSLIFALGAAACGGAMPEGDELADELQGSLGSGAARPALINVIHGSPDAPPVDIYLNDARAVAGLDYRQSTGNVELPAGRYNVKIRGAGAPADSPPVFEADLRLRAGSRQLLLARGRLGDGAGPTAFTVAAYPYGRTARGAAQLRLIHGAPGAPVVDVAASGTPLIRGAAFGDASDYLRFERGLPATTLGVRAAGGSFDLAFVRAPALGAGAVISAIAFGEINPLSPEGRFLDVSVLDEATGRLSDLRLWINAHAPPARLYVFHGSPNAPNVDVGLSLFGITLIRDLAYQKASPILALPGGAYPIEVRVARTRTVVLAARARFLPGLSWTFLARGLVGGAGDQALGLSALPFGAEAPGADASNVRAVHASPDAPAVDIAKGGAVVIPDLAFRQASGYLRLPTAVVAGDLTVRAAGDPTDLLRITVPDEIAAAVAGKTVSIYATGTLGDAGRPFTAIAVVEEGRGPLLAVPLPTGPAR